MVANLINKASRVYAYATQIENTRVSLNTSSSDRIPHPRTVGARELHVRFKLGLILSIA